MKKILIALAACATIASCQKKEDTETIDVSKTTYLMKGRSGWQLKVAIWLPDINDPTSTPVDIYTPMSGCEKDNFFIFSTQSAAVLYEGASKCAVTAPDSIVYSYALFNDDKHLAIFSDPADINASSILNGEITYPSIDSFIVTYTAPNPQNADLTSRYTKTYVRLH